MNGLRRVCQTQPGEIDITSQNCYHCDDNNKIFNPKRRKMLIELDDRKMIRNWFFEVKSFFKLWI